MRTWRMSDKELGISVTAAVLCLVAVGLSLAFFARHDPSDLLTFALVLAFVLAWVVEPLLRVVHRVALRDDGTLELRALRGSHVVPVADVVAVRMEPRGGRMPVELVTPRRTYRVHRGLTPDFDDLADAIVLHNPRVARFG